MTLRPLTNHVGATRDFTVKLAEPEVGSFFP